MDFLDVKIYLEEVENDEINFEEIEEVIDITIQSKKNYYNKTYIYIIFLRIFFMEN